MSDDGEWTTIHQEGSVFDAADLVWTTVTAGAQTVLGAVIYDDRPLTRWEWIRVRVFRRPDPRVVWSSSD